MKWNKFTIETTTAAEDLVSAMLAELGIEGVEIENNVPLTKEDQADMFIDFLPELPPDEGISHVSFYLEDGEDHSALLKKVEESMEWQRQFVDVGSGVITSSDTEDLDWMNNWKEYFHSFAIEDILIKPTWEDLKEEDKDKLLITEIPYTMIGAGINKFLMDVADLVESRKLPDVVDISNQSNKEGIRIVLELKKDADIERIMNILYKKTKLEDTFGVNMLAIAGGRPECLSLKGIFRHFLDFQHENTTRKYQVLLQKELEKKEVQEGLIRACDVIDLIIAILRGAKNLKDAKACLMYGDTSKIQFKHPGFSEDAAKLNFTERQAAAILEMRLYKLIGLEILALEKEHRETLRKIKEYEKILKSRKTMDDVIIADLEKIKEDFGLDRRTRLEDSKEAVYEEEAPAVQEMVFVMDRFGYCKLLDKSTFERNQESIITDYPHVLPCLTSDKLCLFTNIGNLHQIKVADVPCGKMKDKGTPIDNISRYDGGKEQMIYLESWERLKDKTLIFATKQALLKQVLAEEFAANKRMVAATKLQEGDEVCGVCPAGEETEVVLQTSSHVFLRFLLEEIPVVRKISKGVRGIKLGKGEELTALYLLGEDITVKVKEKEVHLNRLKLSKRDGKGSKVRGI